MIYPLRLMVKPFSLPIDLVRGGGHQIPMSLEKIVKTVIHTPFWLYEYLRMPFGILNIVFQNISCAFVYIDKLRKARL